MSRQRVLKELPAGSALLFAGSQYSPDACIPLSAHQGTATLGDPPVNNSLTKRLLSGIIGRWHSRIKQEPEHSFAMLAETLGKCGRLGWQVFLPSQGQYSVFDFEHNSVEPVLWDFVSKMPDMEQSLELNQQGLPKAFVALVRQSYKEFDIANQMSQAELLNLIGVFDISTEEIADNCTVVSFSENISEYLRRTRLGNAEKAKSRGTENPYPVFRAVVLPAGLIDIQNRLSGKMLLKLFIRNSNRFIDTPDRIAKVASSNFNVQHITAKVLKRAIGCVKRALHISNQCLQTQAKQVAFDNTDGQFGPNDSTTYRADKAVQMKFGNPYRFFNKFDSLLYFRFFNRPATPCITAITITGIKRDCFINLIRLKRLTTDAFMAGLAALSSRACCRFRFGRLDNIRRWRLGGIGRILREFSDLVSKFSIDFNKFGNLFFKFGDTLNIEMFFFGNRSGYS